MKKLLLILTIGLMTISFVACEDEPIIYATSDMVIKGKYHNLDGTYSYSVKTRVRRGRLDYNMYYRIRSWQNFNVKDTLYFTNIKR